MNDQEKYLTQDVRERLERFLKMNRSDYTWERIRNLSDDDLSEKAIELTDRAKRIIQNESVLTLPQRVEALYPEFGKMYPGIAINQIPENQLEQIVGGVPVFEVLGFSDNPDYRSRQIYEEQDLKLKRKGTPKQGSNPRILNTKIRKSSGGSDHGYHGGSYNH